MYKLQSNNNGHFISHSNRPEFPIQFRHRADAALALKLLQEQELNFWFILSKNGEVTGAKICASSDGVCVSRVVKGWITITDTLSPAEARARKANIHLSQKWTVVNCVSCDYMRHGKGRDRYRRCPKCGSETVMKFTNPLVKANGNRA